MADEFNSNTRGGADAALKAVEPTFAPADNTAPAKTEAAESAQAPSPAKPQGFGAELRAAREAQGISLGDMAVRSRLSVAQVRALEEEDVAQLPEPVYVRAFIRGCAHSLGLDPQALAEDYMNRYGRRGGAAEHGQIPLSDPSREEVINAAPRHRGLKVALLVVLLAVVSAGIWAVYTDQFAGVHSGSEAQKIESGATETAAEKPSGAAQPAPAAAAPESQPNGASAAQQAPERNPAAESSPAAPAPAASAQPSSSGPVQPQAQAQQQIQPNAAPAAEQPAADGVPIRVVRFEVTSPCWVQVIAPNGRNIIAREMQPGAPVTADIPKGSRITVGNAGALSLTIDGKPYDIRQATRNGISRITLD